MTREDRAVAIVELVAQTMSVINDGERGEHALCHAIARASKADTAMILGPDPARHTRMHAAWPSARAAAPLMDAVVSAHGRPVDIHPAAGEIRSFGVAWAGDTHLDGNTRQLVLSRRDGFSPDAEMLLSEATPALHLLLPQVGSACLKAEYSRNAADAAAALNLTGREVEVLELLAEGLLARTIAARLGLSPRTVHKHLSNVYTKLGVHDRLVAVSFARERGLIG